MANSVDRLRHAIEGVQWGDIEVSVSEMTPEERLRQIGTDLERAKASKSVGELATYSRSILNQAERILSTLHDSVIATCREGANL